MAYDLAEMDQERRWAVYGAADIAAYAEMREIDLGPSKVRKMITMVRRFAGAPKLKALFDTGKHGWTKIALALRHLASRGEDTLVDLVERLSLRELEAELRPGSQPRKKVLRIALTDEEHAIIEASIGAERFVNPTLSVAQAITSACLSHAMGGGTGQRPALVLHQDPSGRTTLDSRHGPVALSPARVEQVKCNMKTVDLRDGSAKVTLQPSRAVEREVRKRDGDRCLVPGCRNLGFIELHDLGLPGERGRDPTHMLCMCGSHHTSVHLGLLVVTAERDGFTFRDAHGRALGWVSRKEVRAAS